MNQTLTWLAIEDHNENCQRPPKLGMCSDKYYLNNTISYYKYVVKMEPRTNELIAIGD